MADLYGALTSSAFKVKDDQAFEEDKYVQFYKNHCLNEGGFFQKDKDKWSFGFTGSYPSWVIAEGLPEPFDKNDLDEDDLKEGLLTCGECKESLDPDLDTFYKIDKDFYCDACMETEPQDEFDFCDVLKEHLLEGEVVQLLSVGNEKMRYLVSDYRVITSKGIAGHYRELSWKTDDLLKNVIKDEQEFVKDLNGIL